MNLEVRHHMPLALCLLLARGDSLGFPIYEIFNSRRIQSESTFAYLTYQLYSSIHKDFASSTTSLSSHSHHPCNADLPNLLFIIVVAVVVALFSPAHLGFIEPVQRSSKFLPLFDQRFATGLALRIVGQQLFTARES